MTELISLYIHQALEIISLAFGFIGVLVITGYSLVSLYILLKTYSFKRSRQIIGEGILLGLEFILAGDVIRTIMMPYYYELGILAGLAIIRTVLSYYLNKELHS